MNKSTLGLGTGGKEREREKNAIELKHYLVVEEGIAHVDTWGGGKQRSELHYSHHTSAAFTFWEGGVPLFTYRFLVVRSCFPAAT